MPTSARGSFVRQGPTTQRGGLVPNPATPCTTPIAAWAKSRISQPSPFTGPQRYLGGFTAFVNAGANAVGTLPTHAGTDGIIVVEGVRSSIGNTMSISDSSGATWTLRLGPTDANGSSRHYVWTAPFTSAQSGATVTVAATGSNQSAVVGAVVEAADFDSILTPVTGGSASSVTGPGGTALAASTFLLALLGGRGPADGSQPQVDLTNGIPGGWQGAQGVSSTQATAVSNAYAASAWLAQPEPDIGSAQWLYTASPNSRYATVVALSPVAGAGPTSVTLPDEAATGTDALAVTVTATLTDTGTGTDALTATVTVPTQTDTGSGTDALSVSAAVPLAETAAGADSLAATATVPLADTGTGIDTTTVTATVPLADTGTGTDAISVAAGSNPSLPDTATGADALSVAATVPLADTGTGADALAATATVPIADTATGSDAVAASATVPLSDAATGTDAITVAAGSNPSLPETATGTDALAVTVSTTLADTAVAADAVTVTATVPLADPRTVADAMTVSAAVTLADLRTVADALVAAAAVQLADITTVADLLTAINESAPQGGRARSGPGGPGARGRAVAAAAARSGGSGPRSGGSSTTGARARTGPNGPHAGGAS